MKSQELILYRNLEFRELFDQIAMLFTHSKEDRLEAMPDSYALAGKLTELAAYYGLSGNLWHCFLTLSLVRLKAP
jgi:uncharacterized protein